MRYIVCVHAWIAEKSRMIMLPYKQDIILSERFLSPEKEVDTDVLEMYRCLSISGIVCQKETTSA